MEELKDSVKGKLKITWEDEDTNKRVDQIVADAVKTLNFKLGIKEGDAPYAEEGQERTLFLNYCMYEWNNSVEEFDERYRNEIMQIRRKYEVKYYGVRCNEEKQAQL